MRARRFTRSDRVATGNTSEVFRWTSTTVVKVLRPGIPQECAAQEADVARWAHAAGLPAPAVDGIVEVDGRPGIVFERIDGRPMWDLMQATPSELTHMVESLVGLQASLHAAAPVGALPSLVVRVRFKIEAVTALPAEDLAESLMLLDQLPIGSALCHGDMHPANILMSSRGMVVVDWFDAATGHPTADLARSSLLMRPPMSSRAVSAFLGGATRAFLTRLHDTYLDTLIARGLHDAAPFATWEAILAVARLAEPVAPGDLSNVWAAYKAGPAATAATSRTSSGR